MKIFKNILLTLSLTLLPVNACALATVSALDAHPVPTVADSIGAAKEGLNQTCSGGSCPSGQDGLTKVLNGVVTIISYIAGIIAVIMIIIAGIRFTTSGGDSNAVSGAKTSLVYALIGIAVAVLAQVLVHFVIGTAQNTG